MRARGQGWHGGNNRLVSTLWLGICWGDQRRCCGCTTRALECVTITHTHTKGKTCQEKVLLWLQPLVTFILFLTSTLGEVWDWMTSSVLNKFHSENPYRPTVLFCSVLFFSTHFSVNIIVKSIKIEFLIQLNLRKLNHLANFTKPHILYLSWAFILKLEFWNTTGNLVDTTGIDNSGSQSEGQVPLGGHTVIARPITINIFWGCPSIWYRRDPPVKLLRLSLPWQLNQ